MTSEPHPHNDVWIKACLQERGYVLTGKHTHFCFKNGGRCVDETTPEWPCRCFDPPETKKATEEMWAIVGPHGFYNCVWRSSDEAIAYHSWNHKKSWGNCLLAGDRCARVRVTELD